jgi:hypothetical protein
MRGSGRKGPIQQQDEGQHGEDCHQLCNSLSLTQAALPESSRTNINKTVRKRTGATLLTLKRKQTTNRLLCVPTDYC